MPKSSPCQPAVISDPAPFGLYLVLKCLPGHAQMVAAAGAELPAFSQRMAKKSPAARLQAAIGFGATLWDAMSPDGRPAHLHAFAAIGSGTLTAPATGGDVFLYVKSRRPDWNLEVAREFLARLAGKVEALDEVHGFRYQDSRDLTGFIDGTMNPKGRERTETALIGGEDPRFAGGSYMLAQRYVHDLARWSGVPVSEQETIIGRRKRDSKELARAPGSAHIRRAELRVDGEEQPIYRQSLPYGTASGDQGLYFTAYSKDPSRFEQMLRRMMGVSGDGQHDRLMEFTRPVSGAIFFVPSLTVLKKLG